MNGIVKQGNNDLSHYCGPKIGGMDALKKWLILDVKARRTMEAHISKELSFDVSVFAKGI